MIIRFNEQFNLAAAEVYSYFHTPADWSGWYAIALKHFPFPLVAKNTDQEANKVVRWVFRGFWRGRGEVRFVESSDGVTVEGFEEIAVRYLFFLSPLFERLFLELRFRAIWEIGWHRLRKLGASRGETAL